MKSILLTIVGLMIFQCVCAQDTDYSLEDLKSPSSPAFTILGVQPSEISSPKSFRALETEFLSNFIGQNSSFILPNNYSVEITPYWLFSHPNMDIQNYSNPNVAEGAARSLSISFSTNQEIISDSLKFDNLGFGGRFNLDFRSMDQVLFKSSYESIKLLQQPSAFLGQIMFFIEDTVNSVQNKDSLLVLIENESEKIIDDIDIDAREQFNIILELLKSKINALSESSFKEKLIDDDSRQSIEKSIRNETKLEIGLTNRASQLEEVIGSRYGFNIEVAFAAKYSLSSNTDIANDNFKKYGVWITPSYTPKKADFMDLLVVLRYIENDTEDIATTDFNNLDGLKAKDFSKNFDYGVRLVFSSPSKINKVPFNLSLEYIRRKQWIDLEEETVGNTMVTRTISQSDERFSFTLDYQISNTLSFNYSVGKSFDKNTTQAESLFSLVGITLGLGGKKASDFNKTN